MARRFTWRLESVKKAKKREEDRDREDLAAARRRVRSAESDLTQLQGQKDDCLDQLRTKQSGHINTTELKLARTYLQRLEGKIEKQNRNLRNTQSVTDQKREILLKTVQEVKVLENLKERDYQMYRKIERRRDQARTDEGANRRANRTHL